MKLMNSRRFLKFFLFLCLLFVPAVSPAADTVTILAAGDVTLAHRISGGEKLSFFSKGAREMIRKADLFFWNCEMSGLSRRRKNNQFIFLSDGKQLKNFAFPNGAACTANNHTFDGYEEGALFLKKSVEAAGVKHNGVHQRGAYSPLELKLKDGTKVFFLTGSPMSQTGSGKRAATLNYGELLSQVKSLRKRFPQAIIVTYSHDGKERVMAPTDRQRRTALALANAGVDVVLFSHSHIYNGFETLCSTPQKTFVAWGLGNFIFGGNRQWKKHADVRMLRITLNRNTGEKSASWVRGYTSNWQFTLAGERP